MILQQDTKETFLPQIYLLLYTKILRHTTMKADLGQGLSQWFSKWGAGVLEGLQRGLQQKKKKKGRNTLVSLYGEVSGFICGLFRVPSCDNHWVNTMFTAGWLFFRDKIKN